MLQIPGGYCTEKFTFTVEFYQKYKWIMVLRLLIGCDKWSDGRGGGVSINVESVTLRGKIIIISFLITAGCRIDTRQVPLQFFSLKIWILAINSMQSSKSPSHYHSTVRWTNALWLLSSECLLTVLWSAGSERSRKDYHLQNADWRR